MVRRPFTQPLRFTGFAGGGCVPLTAGLLLGSWFSGCAAPAPTPPQSSAIYGSLPAAKPTRVTQVSVDAPEPVRVRVHPRNEGKQGAAEKSGQPAGAPPSGDDAPAPGQAPNSAPNTQGAEPSAVVPAMGAAATGGHNAEGDSERPLSASSATQPAGAPAKSSGSSAQPQPKGTPAAAQAGNR